MDLEKPIFYCSSTLKEIFTGSCIKSKQVYRNVRSFMLLLGSKRHCHFNFWSFRGLTGRTELLPVRKGGLVPRILVSRTHGGCSPLLRLFWNNWGYETLCRWYWLSYRWEGTLHRYFVPSTSPSLHLPSMCLQMQTYLSTGFQG